MYSNVCIKLTVVVVFFILLLDNCLSASPPEYNYRRYVYRKKTRSVSIFDFLPLLLCTIPSVIVVDLSCVSVCCLYLNLLKVSAWGRSAISH